MNLARFNELLLESVGVGLAVLHPDTLEIIFANRRFLEWLAPTGVDGISFTKLISDLDPDQLRQKLDAGGIFTTDVQLRVGRRAVSLSFQISKAEHQGLSALIVEAQNVSKIRELEYMIESYSQMVEKQNRTLKREKERAEKLLLNIMPKTVYEELRTFGVTAPHKYENASVLLLDFVGFTQMSVSREPTALIAELNDIFTSFDRIVEQFGCERIKTMGDAYMAVSGVPEPTPDHAHNIAKAALLFRRYLEKRNEAYSPKWLCRIGLGSGPVIGSIVGIQKYVYDIFGPGVNLASRMEALCGPMEIMLNHELHAKIANDFRFTDRGRKEVRGFGTQHVFTLDSSHEQLAMEP
jgi:class 3 adenylate cyclase